ncbi:ABC transporter [Streptomyces albus subsp. albus]|nr:ABC transporter [Streptomyces albus subsp. albus]
MFRTAVRNVLAHKARLMMTALAVLLGVAFVSGTLIFGDTVANSYRQASAEKLEGVAVSVKATESEAGKGGHGRTTALDSTLTQKIHALPGVKEVRSTVNGTATLAGKDGRPVNADNHGRNLATNYQPGEDGKDSHFPLKEGRGPAAAGELALDAKTAARAGYQVGDTVRFATDGPALTKKLVGIVHTDHPQVSAGATLTLFDTATAQKLFLAPDRFDEITVGARPGADDRALTAKVKALLPAKGAEAIRGADLAAQETAQTDKDTDYLTKTLLAFAGVALFVGVFLIANTFTMLIAQRSREIALLRAVGAARRQVVRSVLAEAALLGLGASAVGFVLGIGVASALRPLLNSSGAAFPDGPLVISPGAPAASLVVGVVVTVLAAWLPSRKAARIAPVEVLNSVGQGPASRSLVVRNVLGTLLAAPGLLLMFHVSTLRDTAASNLLIAMAGSALTLSGLIVLAPLLSRPLITLVGKVTTRFFGVGGKLAQRNALRNPRRTAATASALMIGLTLVTGLTVAGHSVQRNLDQVAAQSVIPDYKVSSSSDRGLGADAGDKIAKVPGVKAAVPVTSAGLRFKDHFGSITGTEPAQFDKLGNLEFRTGSPADVGPGKVAVSEEFARQTGLHVRDTMDAAAASGKGHAKLKVVGVYKDNHKVGDALGTLHDVQSLTTGKKLDHLLVTAEPGKAGDLDRDIRKALGDSPLLKVVSEEQLRNGDGKAVTSLNMMYGLLSMAVVIAVLGVVNTLAMSVFERAREIGLLRAVGLDRSGIKQMVRLESVVISLFGAVLGIGTGTFLAWAGGHLLSKSLEGYETVLPWGQLGLFLVLALVTGVLAAIWPARRAARQNMLSSIQST